MKGIVARLHRRLPGEHQIGLTELAATLGGRLDREVLEPRVQEPRKMRDGAVRTLHPRVSPEPNAPQLIRLIRTPYKMHTGHPRRSQAWEPRERLRERERLGDLCGPEDRPRISFRSPAEQRVVPSAPPTRLWRGG